MRVSSGDGERIPRDEAPTRERMIRIITMIMSVLVISICFLVPKAAAQSKYSKMAPVEQYLMEAEFDSPEFWNPKVRCAECLNRQAARSILPIADLRTRMVMAGHSKAEIVSALKAAFDNKQLPDLVVSYFAVFLCGSAPLRENRCTSE